MLKTNYSTTVLTGQDNLIDRKNEAAVVQESELDLKKVILFGVKYWPSRGGTSRVAESIVNHLHDRYSMIIYCYDTVMRRSLPGIEVHWLKPLLPGSFGAFLFYLVSTMKILFGPKVDLIHAHKTDCAVFIPILRLRFKVIATSHEAPYTSAKWNPLMKLYFHVAERFFIFSPNIRTCVSESLTKFYEEKYNREVKFVPNGINRNSTSQDFKKELKLIIPENASLEEPFIVFAARRLISSKGCHTMIEALKKINYQGQLFIAGELDQNNKYIERLRDSSESLRLHFLGFVEPLPVLLQLIAEADLFIFPSEMEAMSLVLLEAASVGIPIVASDIPGNTHLFDDSQVLFFRNRDVIDLSRKLQFAFDNPDKLKAMAENAKAKVLGMYSSQNLAEQYDELYQSLIP